MNTNNLSFNIRCRPANCVAVDNREQTVFQVLVRYGTAFWESSLKETHPKLRNTPSRFGVLRLFYFFT